MTERGENMVAKKEVCRSVKLTDNVNAAKLKFSDQIRLLLSQVSNNDEAELDARLKLSADMLGKKAALEKLLDTAIEKMHSLGENQVTIGVSSEFLPYIDAVTDAKTGKGRFYDIVVYKKDLPPEVRHRFTVVLRTRVS